MTKEFWELTHKNSKSLLDLNLADDLPVHTQTAFSTAAIYRSLSGSRDHSRWVCACDAHWISSTVDTLAWNFFWGRECSRTQIWWLCRRWVKTLCGQEILRGAGEDDLEVEASHWTFWSHKTIFWWLQIIWGAKSSTNLKSSLISYWHARAGEAEYAEFPTLRGKTFSLKQNTDEHRYQRAVNGLMASCITTLCLAL